MGQLVRKNLMVDGEAVRALARQAGTSESEAVRDAVAQALGLRAMAEAVRELANSGLFGDTERNAALYGPDVNQPLREGIFDEPRPRRRPRQPATAADD